MSHAVHIAGTRTFSAEVIDLAEDAGFTVLGLLEPSDRDRVGTTIHDQPVLWLDDPPADGDGAVLVGTGDAARSGVLARLTGAGWRPITVTHPTAHVAASAQVGNGVIVGARVVVGARAQIADHVVIGRGALVGHHTRLEELATLGPGANVAGNARVGREAFVGMGALVRDHIAVGDRAVVAMGSVVMADVTAGSRVQGVAAAAYSPDRR